MAEKRLIDANALRNALYDADAITMQGVAIINQFHTVDAVEVVRCRECIYFQDNNGGYIHEGCRWGHDETPDADDFCSRGERRTSGEI